MTRRLPCPLFAFKAVLLAAMLTNGAWATPGTNSVIALTGDLLSDGLTTITPFDAPVLNDDGTVAFLSAPNAGPGAGVVGLLNASLAGPLTAIASTGSVPIGSTTGLDSQFLFPQINSSGQVAFASTVAGSFHQVLVKGVGATLTTLVETTDEAPGGPDPFLNIQGGNQGFAFGDGGHLAFTAALDKGFGNPLESGIYRVDADGTLIELVREGDASPSGDGAFGSFYRLNGQEIDGTSINSEGVVAFRANLTGTSLGNGNNTGVYKTDGATITRIVRDGDPLPSGISGQKFTDVQFTPALNDAGQAAFTIGVTGPGFSAANDRAIYRGDGATLTEIVRKGNAPPDGNGVFLQWNDPNLDASGNVAFRATLTGTSGGSSDNTGIYMGEGGSLTKVAREGAAAIGGNGLLADFSSPVINDAGQIAFRVDLSGTTGGAADNQALYFYDPDEGLEQIIRKGDSLAGGTVTTLNFKYNFFRNTPLAGSGLNNAGQVAYHFELADGRDGIAIWSSSADYNGDGSVDGSDLTDPSTGWETRFGVDLKGSSFLKWQRQFGDLAAVSVATAVPEPDTALLMIVAIACIGRRLRDALTGVI